MVRYPFLLLVLVAFIGLESPALAQHAHGHDHGHPQASQVGEPGDPKKPARVVRVVMREEGAKMIFIPERIEVKRGEQIRFVLRNDGENEHEFVLGTRDDISAHAQEMMRSPDMMHEEPNAKRLEPKATGEIVWRFPAAGEFAFACLIPGHLEAGMKGTILVK